MLLHVPSVITPEQAACYRARIESAQWVDGKTLSGHQSAHVKYNEQLSEKAPEFRQFSDAILEALSGNQLFFSAALPKQVLPPLFNRYKEGMTFGNHVDGAIVTNAASRLRVRSDISATLFLTKPEDYDGGELLIEDTYGSHRIKLPAGDMILYPSTSLHRVEPVTRGARISSFFWIQSMVRNDAQRTMLFDLDMSIVRLTRDHPGDPSIMSLLGVYHNLLRMWAEP